MGNFKNKDRKCPRCHYRWIGHEEKETDVSIALYLINEAYRDSYDHALLVSRDSDLVPAVRMLRGQFPSKRITIVAPPNKGHSNELCRLATGKAKIRVKQLRACLLPAAIVSSTGTLIVERPPEYAPPS